MKIAAVSSSSIPMKSNLPNSSLNLCFCYPPERKVIVLLPAVGLGCNT